MKPGYKPPVLSDDDVGSFLFTNIGDLRIESDVNTIKVSGVAIGDNGQARLKVLQDICAVGEKLTFTSQETGIQRIAPKSSPTICTDKKRPGQYFFDVVFSAKSNEKP